MGAVHYAIAQRTSRYFRQYRDQCELLGKSKNVQKAAENISLDLVRRGKIKRDKVPKISDALIRHTTDWYPAHCIIREDNIRITSKLSSNFEPVINVVAALEPGNMRHPSGDLFDAFQVSIVCSRIAKNGVDITDTMSGVQLNFHAIARLEEREIEKTNPVYELANKLDTLLIYTTLFQAVCTVEGGRNFAIPYGQHLLLGTIGVMQIPNGNHQTYIRLRAGEPFHQEETGNPERCPLIEIRTAVSYSELTQAQDDLRDAIEHFAESHIEEINQVFECFYMEKYIDFSRDDFRKLVDKLRKEFQPITQMSAWIRQQSA